MACSWGRVILLCQALILSICQASCPPFTLSLHLSSGQPRSHLHNEMNPSESMSIFACSEYECWFFAVRQDCWTSPVFFFTMTMGPMKVISQFVSFSFSAMKCKHYSFLCQAIEPAFNKSALLLYGAGAHPSCLWGHYRVCGRFSSRKTWMVYMSAQIAAVLSPNRKFITSSLLARKGRWSELRNLTIGQICARASECYSVVDEASRKNAVAFPWKHVC